MTGWNSARYQQAGGYLDLGCSIILFCMWIFITGAIFGWFGIVRLKETSKCHQVVPFEFNYCPESMRKWLRKIQRECRISLFFQYLSVVASFIAAVCQV